jgi:hypothetical protein
MMVPKSARAVKITGLAAAMILSAIVISCMKAGDGVGLTPTGTPSVFDPCVVNPAAPGCVVVDSCALPNPPVRCVAVDSCKLPNPPDRCIDCTKVPKPEACLDRAYFNANVLPIFKTHCERCHVKPGGSGFTMTKLSLEASDAWDSLVNIKSIEMLQVKKITMMRVLPGLPDSSYLYQKITKSTPAYGARMPAEASAPLSDADILVIKTWITGRN